MAEPLVWVSALAALTFQGIFQGSQGAALVFVNKVLADAVLWPFGDRKFWSLGLQLGSARAAETSTAQSVVHRAVTPVQRKGVSAPAPKPARPGSPISQMWPQRNHFTCVTLGFLICEVVLF